MLRRILPAALLLSTALTGAAQAAATSSSPSTEERLRALEESLDTVNAQLGDLKRSQSTQYDDVNTRINAVVVKIDNGRPTIATADGNFTLALRTLVQFDLGYYALGAAPAGTDFSSGSNFRRARFGASGTLFH
ncbi:MAG: hypothetical protein JO346_07940, partial [Alphaproteobacteria bacterium]|nr:hypothetical protein [Alphaproteobacteria bacterium]